MPKQGSSFKGDVQVLANTLAPFVTRPNWFKYGNSDLDTGKTHKDILVAHKQLFASLLNICPNLVFPKPVLTAALKQLGQQFPCLAPPGELNHWAQTIMKRLLVACKHVAKAKQRKTPPQWLEHIVAMGDSVAASHGVAVPDGPAAPAAAAPDAAAAPAAAEAHLETHTSLYAKQY